MWLKRLVGLTMIITLVGMNALVVFGLLAPPKKKEVFIEPAVVAVVPVPTVTLAIEPAVVPAQTTSGLKWSTTGNPTDCKATGAWSGAKTPFGSESTGRLATPGNFTYTLNCTNASGSAVAAATVTVGNAIPPKKSVVSSSTANAGGATYCGGRAPCYGKKDIASHSSQGNCWGWNGDRVINVGSFDSAYHQAKSGISSIQIGGVCGTDLGPSLGGSVSAGGQTRNHNPTSKANLDKNMTPYFVGYFDATK